MFRVQARGLHLRRSQWLKSAQANMQGDACDGGATRAAGFKDF